MKFKKANIKDMKQYSLIALLLAAIFFVACTSDDNIIGTQPVGTTFSLSVKATKANDADTRALSLDGTTLNATWAMGDAVTVYNQTKGADLAGTLIAQSDGASTTLVGSLTGTIESGDVLKLRFLSPAYSSQDGTLAGIAATCDYAEATVNVTDASTSPITTSSATFTNQQAIVKFTLKDKATDDALNATNLTVTAGGTTINVTPASATDVLYVAIPAISSQTVSLSTKVGGTDYAYEKSSVTLTNGKYYGFTVSMNEAPSMSSEPLTFEAKEAGATVTFTKGPSVANQIEYSTDGSTWTTYTAPITLANVGDKVCFRGNNATYGLTAPVSVFHCSNDCYIYGNIMSLINPTGYATATKLTEDNAFAGLFFKPGYSSKLYSHPFKQLKLPATTLTKYCYDAMFHDCYNLTTAIELPATTLAEGCYSCMFESCFSLTTAPALPATTMAPSCYFQMFCGCRNLTTAPELPAVTLASNCYHGMFLRCEKLSKTPDLLATTLQPHCYENMFRDCTNLTSVKCLATDISAADCTTDWLYDVSTTGSFTKAAAADWSVKTGYDGIPSGWTVLDDVVFPSASMPLTFEAKEAGAVVTFTKGSYVANQIEYSTDDGITWTTYAAPISLVNIGDKVSFRGDNAAYGASGLSSSSGFQCSKACYVYGNIMSIISSTGYATSTTLTAPYTFAYLFNLSRIYSHPSKKFVLPATTLTDYCYKNMFYGCLNLTIAPDLPAMTLSSGCYGGMFLGCSNLTTAPELSATILNDECYESMFEGCTSLVSAPELPATTLFYECYNQMFRGCTNLITAPELPATTLAEGCYHWMFIACTSLNKIKCLATDISAFDSTTGWLHSVSATGTFTKAAGVDWSGKTGSDGIPSGWTVLEE